jgi:Glycosyl transferase family 11
MIYTRLMGGLGNQLFQYAAGRSLAIRHGTELIIDTSALTIEDKKITKRDLVLQHFSITGTFTSSAPTYIKSFAKFLPILYKHLGTWYYYAEPNPGYDPKFQSLPDNTYLSGYWQSYKYFQAISKILFDELTPKYGVSSLTTTRIQSLNRNGSSVAVHIRRGDYVSLPSAAEHHGALAVQHYINAIELVRKIDPNTNFHIFSDDIAWCRKHLSSVEAPLIFVDHDESVSDWEEIILMSHCKHHIIANSSFSWWGAWLADQRWGVSDRLVIAPSLWFSAGNGHDLSDRYPDHWRVLAC